MGAVAAIVLYPTCTTGWFGDDAYYSNLPAALASGRLHFVEAAVHSYDAWLRSAGRWHPGLVLETYVTFSIFHDRVAYKVFLITLSLAALLAGGHFFTKMIGRKFALSAILWTIACFQIRGYHDSFLAYNGIVQSVTILTFSSLSFFLAYLDKRKTPLLLVSVALYFVACTIYEIAYVFPPLYVVAAWYRMKPASAMRSALSFIIIGLGFLTLSTYLRVQAHVDPTSLYAIRANFALYVGALFDQTTASLPLSYLIFNPSKIYLPAWFGFGIQYSFIAFVLAVVCAYFVLPTRAATFNLSKSTSKQALAFGALLIFLPAVELPALVKYQNELSLGLGYLPVFFEYFGTGVLATVTCAKLIRSDSRRHLAAIAFAMIITLTSGANRKLADILAEPYLTSRESFRRALGAGLLRTIPNRSTLAIRPDLPWVCSDGACIDDMRTSDGIFADSRKTVTIRPLAQAEYSASLNAASGAWTLARLRAK